MITVCFRFDDPSATSDHELERRVLDVFAEHSTPLCVATIPYVGTAANESDPWLEQELGHLIDAQRDGIIDVALHGHSHVNRRRELHHVKSEFAGLPFASQRELMEDGLSRLRSIFSKKIGGFVPPWNTYDQLTVRAAERVGMRYMSAGAEAFLRGELVSLPGTCSLGNAYRTIEQALRIPEFHPLVVVVVHPDDFEEYRDPPDPGEPPPSTNLSVLADLLAWIRHDTPTVTQPIGEVASSVRRGQVPWRPGDLPVHWRFKALFPKSMLLRTPMGTTVLRVLARRLTSLRGSTR